MCAAVQDQQAAYMGLVEQLDWQLDDSAVRSQPGPPLDIPIVNYQGHDVIWHEVSFIHCFVVLRSCLLLVWY